MGYLIAEIITLLLLSAAIGGAIAYWLVRRRYEDVTVSHHKLAIDAEMAADTLIRNKALEEECEQLRKRGDYERRQLKNMTALEATLNRGFDAVDGMHAKITERVSRIERFVKEKQEDPALMRGLTRLDSSLATLDKSWKESLRRFPSKDALGRVENLLSELSNKVDSQTSSFEQRISETESQIAALSTWQQTTLEPHFAELRQQLQESVTQHAFTNAFETLTRTISAEVDTSPILSAVSELPKPSDLDAIRQEIRQVEQVISEHANSNALHKVVSDVEEKVSYIPAVAESLNRIEQTLPPTLDIGPVVAVLNELRDAMPPQTDIHPVLKAIDQLQRSLPPQTDLGPILEALELLRKEQAPPTDLEPVMDALKHLQLALPPATDLGPVLDALEQLAQAEPPQTDLGPVFTAMDDLRRSLPPTTDLDPVLDSLKHLANRPYPQVDLNPVMNAIESVRDALPTEPDMSPVIESVASLERSLPDEPDFSPVLQAIEGLREAQPAETNIFPILEAIETLEGALSIEPVVLAVENLEETITSRANMSPILTRLDQLLDSYVSIQNAISRIEETAPKSDSLTDIVELYHALQESVAQRADLTPIRNALDELAAAVPIESDTLKRISEKLTQLSDNADSARVDSTQIDEIKQISVDVSDIVRALSEHMPSQIDISPLTERIAGMSAVLETLPGHMCQPIDLGMLEQRLHKLDEFLDLTRRTLASQDTIDAVSNDVKRLEHQVESERAAIVEHLSNLRGNTSDRPILERVNHRFDNIERILSEQHTRQRETNLLEKPTFGTPDNLQEISGIGPKLEKLLNGIGVFYLWQIADWKRSDVDFVDTQLEVFRGRIDRDNWVFQAQQMTSSKPLVDEDRSANQAVSFA